MSLTDRKAINNSRMRHESEENTPSFPSKVTPTSSPAITPALVSPLTTQKSNTIHGLPLEITPPLNSTLPSDKNRKHSTLFIVQLKLLIQQTIFCNKNIIIIRIFNTTNRVFNTNEYEKAVQTSNRILITNL